VINVRGLEKSYGANKAVAGIDLTIEPGEIFALLGPNGAGKTTTVEILEGFRDRDRGDVSVLGTDPGVKGEQARKWRNRIGIVLQSTNDAGDLSVFETVAHFAKYYSNPRGVDEVINAVGLTDKSKELIRTLSGGQRRRLDVALGIIGSPELLFLDEPTTGFDPEARRAFWALIQDLRKSGATILLTTHYLDEAEALADRIMLEFPRRVLPLGLAALVALVIFCSLPLVRDAIGQGPVIVANTTMTTAVESGLRQRGSEMSDGIEALKAIVVPFTSDDAPLETSAPIPPFEATAPFKSS
jgi:ABC-2 type transport system ATP-binding protein